MPDDTDAAPQATPHDRQNIGSAASNAWRDNRALGRFEMFLFSAVATVLIVRSALAVTGYPQVGSGGLHVAHVLWGGLLMGVAIVLMEILPGTLVRIRAAFIGGIGFGLFIDEIGKFLTKDVNYFFKPAIAIMYAVFVALYLGVREVLQRRPLNDNRRLALASIALSDLALGQLDHAHRDYALRLLDGVDETSALQTSAQAVRQALTAQRPDSHNLETMLGNLRERLVRPLDRVLTGKAVDRTVFVATALVFADLVLSAVIAIANPGKATALPTVIDTGVPGVVGAALLIVGIVFFVRGNKHGGVEWLQRAVLVQMLFTQVVLFNRVQWAGLTGFALDVVVLWLLGLIHNAVAEPEPGKPDPTSGESKAPRRTTPHAAGA